MAMQKTGEVKEDVTPCEECGRPSIRILSNGKSVCDAHISKTKPSIRQRNVKTAEDKFIGRMAQC